MLASQAAAARDQLSAHLAHEERDALALAQRVLTPEQWESVMAAFNDGLGLQDLAFLAPWVLERLPDAAVQRLRAGKERPLLIMNRLFFQWSYRRRERVAFRHL